jgi:hypothetical protein
MIPERFRKPLIGIATALVIYTLLGFFLAPWLVKETATNAVRDNLGVELKLESAPASKPKLPPRLTLRTTGDSE